jgi:hypothetical protein
LLNCRFSSSGESISFQSWHSDSIVSLICQQWIIWNMCYEQLTLT